jgi:hypothetical protein
MTSTATDIPVRRRRSFSRKDRLTLSAFVGIPTAFHMFGFRRSEQSGSHLHSGRVSASQISNGLDFKITTIFSLVLQSFGMQFGITLFGFSGSVLLLRL